MLFLTSHKQVRSLEEALDAEQEKVFKLQAEVETLTKLHEVIRGLRGEVKELGERLRSAEGARVAALADRQWYLGARQRVEQGLQVGV